MAFAVKDRHGFWTRSITIRIFMADLSIWFKYQRRLAF